MNNLRINTAILFSGLALSIGGGVGGKEIAEMPPVNFNKQHLGEKAVAASSYQAPPEKIDTYVLGGTLMGLSAWLTGMVGYVHERKVHRIEATRSS